MKPDQYTKLLIRLLEAAHKLPPSRAALIGMWFERWANKKLKENLQCHTSPQS